MVQAMDKDKTCLSARLCRAEILLVVGAHKLAYEVNAALDPV